jgi:Spy/CpxP family protein refolding chaperone
MTRQVLFAVMVVATGGLVLAAAQERPRQPREPRGTADPARMRQELGLSEDQAAQLRKLRLDERKAGIRRRADTQLARIALREALDAPSVDEKAVQARVKELSDLQAAGLRARVDGELALRKLLTPEQRQKLMQLRTERPRPRRPEGPPQPPGPPPRPGRAGEDERDPAR